MDIIRGLDALREPLRDTALTIGNFDGVHVGHQALFSRVKEWARHIGGRSAVMTFDPHPIHVLFPERELLLLTSHEQRLAMIGRCGLDLAVVIPFTRDFATIPAEEFVREVLVSRLGVKALVVGHDFRFGRGQAGDLALLTRLGAELGFAVQMVPGIEHGGQVVSSTLIRRLVRAGDLPEAERLLGHPYEIVGTVVHGRARGGRLLGFPTANVRITHRPPLKRGVYAVTVSFDDLCYGGAANLGVNPTFGETELSLEAHLFNFQGDLYGKTITVRFLRRLRDEQRFESIEELIRQIGSDCAHAREIVARFCR